MKDNKHIKNLSIGWVVEAIVDKCHLTPGYRVVRKIVYTDYEVIGTDLFNLYNDLPIIYPIVDLNDNSNSKQVVNGEFVILPCSSINTYLSALNIQVTTKSGFLKKRRIRNLVFENGCAVNEPLFLKRNINLERYNNEVSKLQEFKSVYRTNLPPLAECVYLKNLTKKKNSY